MCDVTNPNTSANELIADTYDPGFSPKDRERKRKKEERKERKSAPREKEKEKE